MSANSYRICHPSLLSCNNKFSTSQFLINVHLQPNFHVKKDYTLAATICHPASGPSSTLQVLTHGLGFDRSYWDYPFANFNYSYVARAVDAGYSTLSWDRLGIADSSHGDPVNEIQLALEVEALHQLTVTAAAGHLCGFEGLKFKKIVHIGHSFGSVMTYALSSQYPSIADAIVLTGFSQVPNYTGLFVLGSNFAPVAAVSNKLEKVYSTGYVVPKSSIGVQMDFFSPGDFDPKMLADVTAHGQPAAIGELLTIGGGAVAPSNFTGAVQIINGEHDLPFCGGNCKQVEIPGSNASDILQVSKPMFKSAKVFETSIVTGAGHGLNLGFSHTEAYKNIMDFLKRAL